MVRECLKNTRPGLPPNNYFWSAPLADLAGGTIQQKISTVINHLRFIPIPSYFCLA